MFGFRGTSPSACSLEALGEEDLYELVAEALRCGEPANDVDLIGTLPFRAALDELFDPPIGRRHRRDLRRWPISSRFSCRARSVAGSRRVLPHALRTLDIFRDRSRKRSSSRLAR